MRKLFALMSFVALLAVSCEYFEPIPNDPNTPEDPNGTEQPAAPVLKIGVEGVINMPAAGGSYELQYEVINPIEGVEVEASADVEWITEVEVAESVTFNVGKNYGEQRIGIVTLTYGDLEAAVAIQQTEALEQGTARLSITSDRKSVFEAAGGSGEITYLLECDVEDALPTVELDVDWIVIDSIAVGTINYTVKRSGVEERRTGHVSLSYESAYTQVTIEQKEATLEPVLTASSTNVYTNDSVEFTVTYAYEDVTAEAVIKEYYSDEVVGTTFTPTTSGDHIFYAEYNNRRSKVLTIHALPDYAPAYPEDANPESYDFNQRILMVDHTGLNCPYCPYMKEAIKAAEDDVNYKDKFNVVYSYSFNPTEVCYSPAAKTLWNYYKNVCSTSKTGMYLTGYPSITSNFNHNTAANRNMVKSQIDELWEENPTASVALAAKIEGNKIVMSTSVKSAVSQNIKIALWILEDDISATQSNATASWMHTHHSVLRDAPTGVSASDIAGVEFGYVEANTTMNRIMEYDLNVSSSWNKDNFTVIAIISAPSSKYDNKYEVVNTAICEVGGSIGFDYKK